MMSSMKMDQKDFPEPTSVTDLELGLGPEETKTERLGATNKPKKEQVIVAVFGIFAVMLIGAIVWTSDAESQSCTTGPTARARAIAFVDGVRSVFKRGAISAAGEAEILVTKGLWKKLFLAKDKDWNGFTSPAREFRLDRSYQQEVRYHLGQKTYAWGRHGLIVVSIDPEWASTGPWAAGGDSVKAVIDTDLHLSPSRPYLKVTSVDGLKVEKGYFMFFWEDDLPGLDLRKRGFKGGAEAAAEKHVEGGDAAGEEVGPSPSLGRRDERDPSTSSLEEEGSGSSKTGTEEGGTTAAGAAATNKPDPRKPWLIMGPEEAVRVLKERIEREGTESLSRLQRKFEDEKARIAGLCGLNIAGIEREEAPIAKLSTEEIQRWRRNTGMANHVPDKPRAEMTQGERIDWGVARLMETRKKLADEKARIREEFCVEK